MSNIKSDSDAGYTKIRHFTGMMFVVLNIVLLSGAFLMYSLYVNAYDDRLKAENLGNIANLNRSASVNATTLFDSWKNKLDDVVLYAEMHGLTHKEFLSFISDTNSSSSRYFEIIGADYTGYLAKRNSDGSFPALDYSHSSYKPLQKIFDGADEKSSGEVLFAPEFTDNGESAKKFFATYRHVSLVDENGLSEPYTVLLATSSESVLETLNAQSDYNGQSTVLIDSQGYYIVSSKDYKSSNFFQYLYVYNDLTLDQKNAVKTEMEKNGSGELYYKNSETVVEDCVFRYERMRMGDWYCITSVPLSSFHTPAFNISYIYYAIAFLLVLFMIDMMWQIKMNRRLKSSMQREKEANAAKGNFMSRMSHEIRTPLNAVIGYNTIAIGEMSEAKNEAERKQAEMKVMDCLGKSEIASKHLLTIINDVLDMSAIESGKILVAHEKFDFKGLITSLTTVFYSQARAKGVEFNVIFGTLTEEWFIGDQMRTNQILTNLLSNAVKFTGDGGSVTLKITQPDAEHNSSHIHFEVTDTGIGMNEEYLKHIWRPFEQADSSISRRFGGTGLGLSITKNLVDLMNGTITVKSVQGEGTTFDVDLTFEKTEQPEKTASAYNFSAVNALVVDDDVSTCDYIRLLFNRCGARCAAVNSGKDALKAISVAKEQNESFTICLVDWRMPEMDGIETIRRIRETVDDKLPIIVLTAYDYTELADKANEIGVSRFISKPLFQSSLFDLLAGISGAKSSQKFENEEKFDFAGARALLAEDNAMNMEIASTIMRSAGLTVDAAWNGKEAVDNFLNSKEGTYKVILMDVHMPEMDGHEAAKTIRSSNHPEAKSIPIIAMTADAFQENVAEAYASGMNGHIAKPIDVPTLMRTLKQYM